MFKSYYTSKIWLKLISSCHKEKEDIALIEEGDHERVIDSAILKQILDQKEKGQSEWEIEWKCESPICKGSDQQRSIKELIWIHEIGYICIEI